jgi:hypothetical protein
VTTQQMSSQWAHLGCSLFHSPLWMAKWRKIHEDTLSFSISLLTTSNTRNEMGDQTLLDLLFGDIQSNANGLFPETHEPSLQV